MDDGILMQTILRIERMELCFDVLQKAAAEDAASVERDAALQALLRGLKWYYGGGLWLKDYETDEQGLLPADLKRGVLSEDGIYNLLSSLDGDKE